MRARRILATVLALAALAAAAARADVHPNTAPGFPGDQSFHVGDVDNVNLFNGALTLTIPIGISYPVNGGFSYGLKLVYNSTPWLFQQIHYEVPPDFHEVTRTRAIPNPCSNAGLGWRVSLGRFDPPCQVPDANDQLPGPIYQDENGTDHVFYGTLHHGDAEDAPVAGVQDVQYTRDGSYLRMKLFTDGNREVEFPDGTVRRFDSTGRITKISDRFGNNLSISYATANQWVLTDSQGRIQRVHFRTTAPVGVVDRIELTAFGGTTATYQLNYAEQSIGRACPHNDNYETGNAGKTVLAPLLTSVTLPDGSSWSAPAADYVTAIPGAGQDCTDHGGNLAGLKLPTLGRLEWTWQKYTFPSGASNKPHQQNNSGVATRTMRDPDGTVLGTWTYVSAPVFPGAGTAKEHTTTVTDPLGHRTVHYFSVALDFSYTGWSRYDYSLPFTRNQPINVGGVDLGLSREVYNSGGTLLRSEYVTYERDPISGVDPPSSTNTNRRVLRSRTVYYDDASLYGGAINSTFDGLGHYRQQQTEGTFPGSNIRTHFGNFNPSRGTYTVNAGTNTGSGYSAFPPGSAWVLEAPSYAWDSEGTATAWTDLCYATDSAAVTRRRVHRQNGSLNGAQDLVAVYNVSNLTSGNVASEKFYGGDDQAGIPTGSADLCTMALPANPEIQIDHTYASGARATSKYTGSTFYVLNQTIDASTGLPSASRDTAGLETFYEFDSLGRLTWAKPPAGHGGWTQYVYTAASGTTSSRANVAVRRRANGSNTAAILAVDQLVFDYFGRLYQEQKKITSTLFNKRETLYDAAGNKASVSEWTTGTPSNKTFYLGYDPFGRPGTIRPPDGAAHDATLTYTGASKVERAVKISTASGVESTATTTEIYDLHGRLLSVTEPSGASSANVTTTYGYDVGNRLASVSTTATVNGSEVTQTRGFNYDKAGLLQSETHPEKGAAGNGSVTYPRYDSRGHVLRKIDGANDLTFTYDVAERLTQVQETAGAARVLKAFTYATANGTSDWRQGKLRTATRYNYLTMSGAASTVQVAETYTYGGRDGRVSQRDTAVTKDGSNVGLFTQGFTYNDLGLVSVLDYPRCTHAGCTQLPAAIFSDVPVGHAYQLDVEAIYPNITSGCGTSPRTYCPDAEITRGQMAVFLLRAKEGPAYVPPACQGLFTDMPCSGNSPYVTWAEELYRRGITSGCTTSPLQYCPNSNVTNAQMSVFLLQAMGVGAGSAGCTTAPYADVPCSYWAAAFIAEEARRQIAIGCPAGFCPEANITRKEMARLMARAFDIPLPLDPNTQRSVQFAYSQGLLNTVTSGGTTYGTLSYHPNLLISQVVRNNGITDMQGNDPQEMRRPASLAASGAPYQGSWSSGAYGYDGAGNIKTIGTSVFTYDKVNRLVTGTIYDGATGGGTQKQQTYTFDAFGNLTNIAGNNGRATPTAPQTNRLNAAGTVYDAAGNLINWNEAVYEYDRFNQMIRMISGTEKAVYAYTADDERIWSSDELRNVSHWTLRDLGGKVLRDYQNNGRWTLSTDYLYRDGLLLAAETQTGQRHFHLDHLGTPRLITKASGYQAAYHVYYPFGEEATAINQDAERMKFTGHERDLASSAGAGDDLDYMHARYCSPLTGRFLSTDIAEGKPQLPQSWHRYVYAYDNPVKYIDPNGQDGLSFSDYGGATLDALTRTSDQLAFAFAYPYFKFREGVMNDSPGALGQAVGLIALDALGNLAVEAAVAGRGFAVARSAAVSGASEGLMSFTTKAAAREGVASLGLGEAQAAAVNKTIGRATTASRIDVLVAKDGSVIVQTTRAGRNGYQVIQTIIEKNGEKKVVQLAYDEAGKLVHVDPKN